MTDARTDRLVWIDLEMTGLDPAHDEIVEIAAIVTDAELTELDAGISLVVRPPDLSILEGMEEVVVRMHTESGLLDDIPSGITLADAGAEVLAYVRGHVSEPRRAPLAGSSVYVDRGFLARYLPELDEYMHYRLIDVSTIKELARRWYPRSYFNAPAKTGGTAPWPTSGSPSPSCATTGTRCSWPCPDPPPMRPGQPRRTTWWTTGPVRPRPERTPESGTLLPCCAVIRRSTWWV